MIDPDRIRDIISRTRLILVEMGFASRVSSLANFLALPVSYRPSHVAKRAAIFVLRDADELLYEVMFGPMTPTAEELRNVYTCRECAQIARQFLKPPVRDRRIKPVVDPVSMVQWLLPFLSDAATHEAAGRGHAKQIRRHAHRVLTSRREVSEEEFSLLVLGFRDAVLWLSQHSLPAKQSPKRPPPKSDAERAELATRAPLVPLVPRTRFHWTGDVSPTTVIGGPDDDPASTTAIAPVTSVGTERSDGSR